MGRPRTVGRGTGFHSKGLGVIKARPAVKGAVSHPADARRHTGDRQNPRQASRTGFS